MNNNDFESLKDKNTYFYRNKYESKQSGIYMKVLKTVRGYETLFLMNYKRHPSTFKPGWKSSIQRRDHHHQEKRSKS